MNMKPWISSVLLRNRFRAAVLALASLSAVAASFAWTPPASFRCVAAEAYGRLTEQQRRSPECAVAGLDVAPGLEATLFAHEPMLVSPSNMDIDHRGRVWVVEVVNYRLARNTAITKREGGDRILILEDTNADGRADKQTVFYQGPDVNAALGIAVFGNKVVVTSSPNVIVFTDENGDDKPDSKELLFTGMSGADHDHGAHAVVFGPDGKLYFNFGNAGKQIKDRAGNVIVDRAGNAVEDANVYRQGMVFRSNMDGSDFETLGHNFRNNYEVAVDAYGSMWQSDNDDDGNRAVRINYVMEYGNFGFVDEKTGAGWRSWRTGREDSIPQQHWHQADPGVVPNLLITGAGSPTGIAVYEGRLLPSVYHDQIIHTDAGPNVVRAYPVEAKGAGFTARSVDILRGTRDRWFRPSDVTTAPDGSIMVADWNDPAVGGHEMADNVGRGRIFRVAPPNTPYRVPQVDFSTPEGAVEALKSPNLSTQYMAWTALNQMQRRAEPALQTLWRSPNPRQRARALWLLSKIEGRGNQYVTEALRDPDENIRVTAVRAARQMEGNIIPHLQRVVRDPSAAVRREVAIALRDNRSPEAATLWAELATQHDGQDRWYLEALGIGSDRQAQRFFSAWQTRVGAGWNTPAGRDIVWRSRAPAAMPLLAEVIADPNTRGDAKLRYFRAFDFHADTTKDAVLVSLLTRTHPEQAEIRALALKHVGNTNVIERPGVRAALNETLASLRGTQMFVDLVARFDIRDQNEELVRLAYSQPRADLALEAVRQALRLDGTPVIDRVLAQGGANAVGLATALGRNEDRNSKDILERLVLDPSADLAVRRVAVEGLGRGWGGEARLLAVVQQGKLAPELRPAASGVLLSASRAFMRAAAAEHLGAPAAAAASTLPPIPELAARTGNPVTGKPVYDRVCQTCHVVNGAGTNFGPELSDIGNKLPKEAIFLAIVDPSAGIVHGYEAQTVQLRDGSTTMGFLVSETSDAVELRLPTGTTQRFERSNITSMTRLETSLMPPGLHQAMTQQELVDLVEYLTTLRQGDM